MKIAIAAALLSTLLLLGCDNANPLQPSDTASSAVAGNASKLALTVYKTPSCGCCKKWVTHLEQQGIVADSKNYDDLSSIKTQYGIRPQYLSCHTAVSEQGYAFEGHIPARYIKQFLSESHPDAIGLSVPAMPLGSPGMEVEDRFMPYDILLLHKDGTASVYAHISDATMQ